MDKLHILLLVLGLWAPEWCLCSDGGRDIMGLEFPFTAHVKRHGAPGYLCMGIIYGSVTVISGALCEKVFEKMPPNVAGLMVEPSDNIYGSTPDPNDMYPVEEAHKDVRKAMAKLCYTVLKLEMPGIQVESARPGRSPEEPAAAAPAPAPAAAPAAAGDAAPNATNPGDASAPMAPGAGSMGGNGTGGGAISAAAKFISADQAKSLMGDAVVPCVDKKVVAVKIMAMEDCKKSFEMHIMGGGGGGGGGAAGGGGGGAAAGGGGAAAGGGAGGANQTRYRSKRHSLQGYPELMTEKKWGTQLGLDRAIRPKRSPEDPPADAPKPPDAAAAPAADGANPAAPADGPKPAGGPAPPGGGTDMMMAQPDLKMETLDPNMICVQKAAMEVPLEGGKGVPPGMPCPMDVGAPLVRGSDKMVLGVLLYAWCKTSDDMAVFVTTLEEDTIANVPMEGTTASTSAPPPPGPPPPPPGPAPPPPGPRTTPRSKATSITPFSLLTSSVIALIFSNILNAGQ